LFKSILEKFWKKEYIKRLDKIFLEKKEENKELFRKAKKYKIWFIIFYFHIKQFLDDIFRWTDILQMLKDMWFELEFFVYKFKNNITDLKELQDNYKNIIYSSNINDLNNFLDSDSISLYYSEINRDLRILKRNKEIFSIWDLEYWIEWFYRTFQKLVKKCEKVDYLKNLN
jgi:hypothetical protein